MAFKQDLTKRLLSKIEKTESCWIWIGQTGTDGYGKVKIERKTVRAHRAIYEHFIGPIIDGLWVLHKCDNPKCVCPDHLFLGTPKDNVHDSMKKGRFYLSSEQYKIDRRTKKIITRPNPPNPPKKPYVLERKLNQDKANEIRKKYKFRVYTQKMLAKEYGVHQTMINEIITGKIFNS